MEGEEGLEEWERRVAEALLSDESFNRRAGRDFLWLHSSPRLGMSSAHAQGGDARREEHEDEIRMVDEDELAAGAGVERGAGSSLVEVLDSGPMIATSERYRSGIPPPRLSKLFLLPFFIHTKFGMDLSCFLTFLAHDQSPSPGRSARDMEEGFGHHIPLREQRGSGKFGRAGG